MAPRKCSVGLREIVPLLLVLAGLVERVMLASCPPRCVCEGDYTTVSCTNGGLQQVPKGTPYGALSLSLSGNNISGVIADQFTEFRQLQTLDLSFNMISEIEDEAFVGLESLHTLQLYYNRLTFIPTEALRRLPHLKELWLRDDDLRCGNGTKTKSAGTKVNINVMEGDDASLPCITGRTAAVSWITPNGTILRSKSFRVRVKVLEDGTLNLTRVTMHDAGSYKCIPMGNREPSSTAEVITTLNVTKKGLRKSVNTEVPLLEEPVAKDIGDMSCDTVKDTGAARNISVENSTTTVSTPSTVGTTNDGMDVDYEPDPDKDKQVDHQWIIIGSIVGIVAFGMCFWSTIFIAHRFRHRRCRHDHSRSPDDDQDDEYMVNGMVPQTSFYGLVLSEEQKPETPPPVYSIDVDDEDDCIMYHGVKTFKSDKPIKPVKTVTFKVETEV
ncbi:LRRC4C [Branchiostoma lanceolatum]|uniref:LRRC4C protein n=1 Tax=Branchiostoma lanceolatum TaxID=7740 RepID=A0A8K0AGV3_BRALA|nr:LRRC4C [Branchiostoma lanceolatum]